MNSDPALLGAFRKQLAMVLASENAMAFLGLWAAWKDQPGVNRDDLIDIIKADAPDLAGGML